MVDRVCLDLNVLLAPVIAAASARALGRSVRPAATRELVRWAHRGASPSGPYQLVCSESMLAHLETILLDRMAPATRPLGALRYPALLREAALRGPAPAPMPFATLGPVQAAAFQDAEDARVFADAVAGGADLLVTATLSDFAGVATETPWVSKEGVWLGGTVPLPGRAPLQIAHPRLAAQWLRSGTRPHPAP